MILPRQHNGRPYISFSQINLWNDIKSFNLKIDGKEEYMLKYFFGREFPDKGWGEFGHDVEDYICYRKGKDKFTTRERDILEQITPLGDFQVEGYLNMGEYDLKLVIDDILPDKSKLRDYKTASKNSAKKYYKDDYYQTDLYGMWVEQETGNFPELEVCIVERAGNCMFSGGREKLSVKGEVWYVERESSPERTLFLKEYIDKSAREISSYYQTFLNINK